MDIEKNLNNNLIIANNNVINVDEEKPQINNDESDQKTIQSIGQEQQQQQQKQHLKRHRQFYAWIKRHLWIFPLILSTLLIILCIIPYIMSIHYGNVDPLLPYVSDTGGLSPGSMVFSQIIDFIAILIFITCWIRYKQIKFYLNNNFIGKNLDYLNRLHRMNRHSFWLMIISGIGAIGVGNIRTTEFYPLHVVNALTVFISACIYACYSTHLARILYREYGIESQPITMMFCAIITSISMVMVLIFESINRYQVGNEKFENNNQFRMHWPQTDKESYYVHVTATTFEWIMIFTFAIFILCLCRRFRMIGS
ncbi:DNA damage-regulated autophagy modulator protein 2 [Dermatophagoides farinae]|uniref:DNA damage-regulated autophagy modulator protein 2 n=1 Tax=Dermatophagoides farinae TaxID=6954 RepID=UPI003F60D1A2